MDPPAPRSYAGGCYEVGPAVQHEVPQLSPVPHSSTDSAAGTCSMKEMSKSNGSTGATLSASGSVSSSTLLSMVGAVMLFFPSMQLGLDFADHGPGRPTSPRAQPRCEARTAGELARKAARAEADEPQLSKR